jgi:hypothetical protein
VNSFAASSESLVCPKQIALDSDAQIVIAAGCERSDLRGVAHPVVTAARSARERLEIENEQEAMAPHNRHSAATIVDRHGGATIHREPALLRDQSAGQGNQPAWQAGYPLPELPYLHQLEADPIDA